jgi:hypothetical protein
LLFYASISLTNDTSFLTLNDSSSPSKQRLFRRQSADQPLVYNASQYFASINGDTYNVSAYAQQAQNGPNPPNCSTTICVYNSCSAPAQLQTATWQQYYYLYLATYDDDSAPATFSATCVGNAYVALDSIEIEDIPPPSASTSTPSTDGSAPPASSNGVASTAGSDGSMYMTTLSGGSVRTVTRTIVRTRTTSAVVSTAICYTTTQISYVVSTYESYNTYTTTQPTTFVSTAYATATSYQTFTVSAIVTSTIESPFMEKFVWSLQVSQSGRSSLWPPALRPWVLETWRPASSRLVVRKSPRQARQLHPWTILTQGTSWTGWRCTGG